METLEEEEDATPGMSARPIPEELLNTDTRKGLTSPRGYGTPSEGTVSIKWPRKKKT